MTDTQPSFAIPPLEEVSFERRQLKPKAKRGVPVPWWVKIPAKVVLSRVMSSYSTRKALRLFQHGSMDRDPNRQIRQVERVFNYHRQFSGSTPRAILELGPGDSVGMALVAKSMGMDRSYLVDVGDFASTDMAVYGSLIKAIGASGHEAPAGVDLGSRQAMLASVNGTYLTGGTPSLHDIPDGSVDMVFSAAVLEHVARHEFHHLLAETYRLMSPGGVAHHQIDLMDHLGGALNSLRFGHGLWEGKLMSNSGFYTNRLRLSEILDAVVQAGFRYAVTNITEWPSLPTPRSALARDFEKFSDDELRIATFGILLLKPRVPE